MLMRTCTVCGIEKPLETDYQDHASGKDGKRTQCKVCRNDYIRKRNGLAKKVYAERKHPDAVPPRTFSHLLDEPWDGQLGAMYIRNDGLKHIKSRGV